MKPSFVPPARTLNQRKQDSVRESICEHATRLFVEQGFHATTIDDIARASAIGRRTFFRYFKGKEDVVLWKFDQFARCTVELLGQRPAREPGLTALQTALTQASEFYNQQPAQTLAILKLTDETPPLLAQHLLQQERWKEWFADALARRRRGSPRSLLPALTAAVALQAMALAVRRWVADPDCDLSQLMGASFAALRQVIEPKRERVAG